MLELGLLAIMSLSTWYCIVLCFNSDIYLHHTEVQIEKMIQTHLRIGHHKTFQLFPSLRDKGAVISFV